MAPDVHSREWWRLAEHLTISASFREAPNRPYVYLAVVACAGFRIGCGGAERDVVFRRIRDCAVGPLPLSASASWGTGGGLNLADGIIGGQRVDGFGLEGILSSFCRMHSRLNVSSLGDIFQTGQPLY